MSQVNKFEEYTFFIEDTARLTERRQTVTNIYVAVNTVLLSAVALLVKDAGLQRGVVAAATIMLLVAATLMLLVAGMVICAFWRQLIIRYKKLIGLRLDELRQMEELPEMAGCQRMYHVEDKLYPRDAQGNMRKAKGGLYPFIETSNSVFLEKNTDRLFFVHVAHSIATSKKCLRCSKIP